MCHDIRSSIAQTNLNFLLNPSLFVILSLSHTHTHTHTSFSFTVENEQCTSHQRICSLLLDFEGQVTEVCTNLPLRKYFCLSVCLYVWQVSLSHFVHVYSISSVYLCLPYNTILSSPLFSFSLTLPSLCKHIRQPLDLIGSYDGVATTFHPCRDLTLFNNVTTSRSGQHYLVDISILPLLLFKHIFLTKMKCIWF